MDIKFVQILNSRRKDYKYQANFLDSNHNVIKKTDFGLKNAVTYNMDHDMEKKQNWIILNNPLSDYANPTSSSTLETYLLWNKPSLSSSFQTYLKVFEFTAF
jgi:hypothetical protein